MSDEVFPTPTRQIDIPSRFIRQAMDHIEHTGSRYVTFLFTGEQVIDAICVGVTTRLLIAGPTARPPAPPKRATPMPSGPWTISSLTNEVILAQVEEHGPINVRRLGDNLGIPGSNMPLRQRVRRVLESLVKQSAVRKISTDGAMPDYIAADRQGPLMPLRTRGRPRLSRISRRDITEDKLLHLIQQNGRISSRSMGDALNIPRPDTLVRGKITQLVHDLVVANRIRICEGTEEGGGRLYEMVNETAAEA